MDELGWDYDAWTTTSRANPPDVRASWGRR